MASVFQQISHDNYLGNLTQHIKNFSLENRQILEQSCAVNAQTEYLKQASGIDVDEKYLLHYAHEKGFYTLPFEDPNGMGGTPTIYSGRILEDAGIKGQKLSNFEELENSVKSGNNVLTSIDTKEFYSNSTEEMGNTTPDHEVIVEGITKDGNFKIYNPAFGNRIEIDRDILREATNEPNLAFNAMAFPDYETSKKVASEFHQKLLKDYSFEDVSVTYKRARIQEFKESKDGNYVPGEAVDNTNINENYVGEREAQINEVELQESLADLEYIADSAGVIGVFGLTAYFDENPKMKAKVLKAGATVGVIDSVMEVGEDGIDVALEASPILIASLFVSLTEFLKRRNSKTTKININPTALKIFQQSMNVVKYTAVGAFALDTILEINDSVDLGVEVIDEIDGLLEAAGFVADGADVLDTIATFGLSILASQAIKKYGESKNDEVLKDIGKYREKMKKRKVLGSLLASNLPPAALVGVKREFDKS